MRLLTLTGPGGTGKTRLSLQEAEKSLNLFISEVVKGRNDLPDTILETWDLSNTHDPTADKIYNKVIVPT